MSDRYVSAGDYSTHRIIIKILRVPSSDSSEKYKPQGENVWNGSIHVFNKPLKTIDVRKFHLLSSAAFGFVAA
jgi:hypothetical protein